MVFVWPFHYIFFCSKWDHFVCLKIILNLKYLKFLIMYTKIDLLVLSILQVSIFYKLLFISHNLWSIIFQLISYFIVFKQLRSYFPNLLPLDSWIDIISTFFNPIFHEKNIFLLKYKLSTWLILSTVQSNRS